MKLQAPILINIFKNNIQTKRDEGNILILQSNQEIMITSELNFDKESLVIGKNGSKEGTQILLLH